MQNVQPNTRKASDYIKFHFASKEAALSAKKELGNKFRGLKIKVNEHGSLFFHDLKSFNFYLVVASEAVRLGGVEA